MNEIALFNYEGLEVRTVTRDGEAWVVAADVCTVLGLTNASQTVTYLDDDERSTALITSEGGQERVVNVVNESGLYSLILRSRKPEARPFRRWITHEVLPAIRRTGSYTAVPAPRPELSNRDLALMVIAEADRADAAEAKVTELAPAADSWNTLATASGDLAVADAAKLLSRDPAIQVGRDRLFTILRDLRWIYRQGIDQRWRAYQTVIDNGRLTELTSSHYHPRTGELVLDAPQVRVTVKGLGVLHRHLGGSAALAITAGDPS